MTQKWFVSQGDRVYGPWSTDDVFTHRGQGNVSESDLIWGSGLDEWVTIARWTPGARPAGRRVEVATRAEPAVTAATAVAHAAPIARAPILVAREAATAREDAPTKLVGAAVNSEAETKVGFEVTEVTAVSQVVRDDAAETVFSPVANEAWHYAANGASHGPFNRPNLVLELRRLSTLDGVVLWTKGMREWAGLFEFHEIANELGISQRQFARASVQGRAVLTIDGLTQVAPLASISEGGLGLQLNSEFFAGQPVTVEVQSDALGAPFSLAAEVRYCAQGRVGLKFTAPTSAVRSRIAGFVKHAGQARAA